MNTNDPKSKDPEKRTIEKKGKTAGTHSGGKRLHDDFSKKRDYFFTYARTNQEQLIAYVILIFGLIFLLFFNPLVGGLLIGMVAGYYFSAEIIYYLRNLGQLVGGKNQLQYVILTAVLLGLFIAAPGIFIGALIVASFKQVFTGPKS